MYKLVKEKNIGFRILMGIVILFAITQTLKFFLREPKLNINDEINKHTPIVLDSLNTLENVNALQGNLLKYNYTINADKSSIDTTELKRLSKENFMDILKKNPKADYFKQNNIQLQANYTDKNRVPICNVVVLSKDFK
jgi:hypothetical protein